MNQAICIVCGNTHSGHKICDECFEELKKDLIVNDVGYIGNVRNMRSIKSMRNMCAIDNENPPIDNFTEKALGNTSISDATENVKDIVFWGDKDAFKLISKAFSEDEGWMKSTKAMQVGSSVVIQVTTQQRNPDGSYSVAEALTTVPNASIEEEVKDDIVVSRRIVSNEFK